MSGRAPIAGRPGAARAQPVVAPAPMWQRIATMAALFIGTQMLMKFANEYFLPKPADTGATPATAAVTDPSGSAPTAPLTSLDGISPATPPSNVLPLWPPGTPLVFLLYLTTSPDPSSPVLPFEAYKSLEPVVRWDGLTLGNWTDERVEDLILDVPREVQANATWWADMFLVAERADEGAGASGTATETGRELSRGPMRVMRTRKMLTRYQPRRKVRKEKRLISSPAGGKEEGAQAEEGEDELEVANSTSTQPIISYWAPNLTVTIVSDAAGFSYQQQADVLKSHIQLEPTGMRDAKGAGYYYPILFPNDFWLLKENQYPINQTTPQLPLRVQYHPLSFFKFTIYASMTASFDAQAAGTGPMGGGGGSEIDELKHMLMETNPWLLAVTILVTLLHTVFEFLAFSSDVQHWRKKDKDLVGVSLRTILTNVFVQLVIMLYLQDSSEETSFMVLAGQGIGLLIEAWKITKVIDIRVRPAEGGIIPYSITFEDKKVLSEDEKKTQEYDRLAFKIVGICAIPVMTGYTIYSMLYQTHRGWYSFIVTTLAQAIYMFGFAQLIPQLIINYKLKSVAHMPMKAMVYKTLGTVVDDFAAFVIRMPWLHRLACFRDDVVFLILLYQRWIYRVDPKRVNEYGQTIEGTVEPVGETKEDEAVVAESRKDR